VRLDFTPGRTAMAEQRRNCVPEVLGYTATVAERKLRNAGYVTEVHSQAVTSSAQVGKVLSQLPAARAEAAAKSTVRLFLGKAS
jgi:beta-lactam-binding protein with PASTA domain